MMRKILKYKKNNNLVKIDLCKSAPIQIKPIEVIKELCNYWKSKKYLEIIDIGCGKLRNSLVLAKYFSLWVCDFAEQFENPIVKERLAKLKKKNNFKGIIYAEDLKKKLLNADAVFMSFVIHTIPEKRLRVELIKNAIKNTKHPHEIFIAVPHGESYYKNKRINANKLNDGILVHIKEEFKTFYKDYSGDKIDNFMGELGFKIDRSFSGDKKKLRTYIK